METTHYSTDTVLVAVTAIGIAGNSSDRADFENSVRDALSAAADANDEIRETVFVGVADVYRDSIVTAAVSITAGRVVETTDEIEWSICDHSAFELNIQFMKVGR